MNLAYLNLLRQDGIKPDVAMGHSLGQFSALVAAECLRVEQVFSVVQKRAELMSQVTRPGMLCSVIAAIILKFTMGNIEISLGHAIALSVIMDVAGVYGDLFESQWKRYYLVKDSGDIIPGHGGLLDRFDSTIFSIPVGALYLILMNIF